MGLASRREDGQPGAVAAVVVLAGVVPLVLRRRRERVICRVVGGLHPVAPVRHDARLSNDCGTVRSVRAWLVLGDCAGASASLISMRADCPLLLLLLPPVG